MAALAEHSADVHYRRIPRYVQSHYLIRKLDEFAEYMSRRVGRLPYLRLGTSALATCCSS